VKASPADQARAVREGCGLFRLEDRTVIEVSGDDRTPWLQGQISGDVARLDPAGRGAGCYAVVLTAKGRIVADVHVVARPDAFWLETDAAAREATVARLERYIVADDVALGAPEPALGRLGLEGPRAPEVLAEALGAPPDLAPEQVAETPIEGHRVVLAAWGFSNLPAYQLFVPADGADAVAHALHGAGRTHGLIAAGAEALEVLRVESGRPRLFRELDEEVLPAEARLDHALAVGKGCYTGQEIIERMRSRGQVGHLLVGLRPGGDGAALEAGAELFDADGKRVGEVTSTARSPAAGAIGLGFVRRALAEPGTRLRTAAGADVAVAALPFVAAQPAAPGAAPGAA